MLVWRAAVAMMDSHRWSMIFSENRCPLFGIVLYCRCGGAAATNRPDRCSTTMADNKSNKLKARLPRGLADIGPAEIAATRRMIETIRQVYELYGFEPVETPAIEYTD